MSDMKRHATRVLLSSLLLLGLGASSIALAQQPGAAPPP
jgi:hypothetical protein